MRALLVVSLLLAAGSALASPTVEPLVLHQEESCSTADGATRCERDLHYAGLRADAAGERAQASVGHHDVHETESEGFDHDASASDDRLGAGAQTSTTGPARVDAFRHRSASTFTHEDGADDAWSFRHVGSESQAVGVFLSGPLTREVVLAECGDTLDAHAEGTGGYGYSWDPTYGRMTGGDDYTYTAEGRSWCFVGARTDEATVGVENGWRTTAHQDEHGRIETGTWDPRVHPASPLLP